MFAFCFQCEHPKREKSELFFPKLTDYKASCSQKQHSKEYSLGKICLPHTPLQLQMRSLMRPIFAVFNPKLKEGRLGMTFTWACSQGGSLHVEKEINTHLEVLLPGCGCPALEGVIEGQEAGNCQCITTLISEVQLFIEHCLVTITIYFVE